MIGFNKGGMVQLGCVVVIMVYVVYFMSFVGLNGLIVPGIECGFMILGEGCMIYVLGDIDVMVDMEIFNDLYVLDIGVFCVGGYFIMDMKCVVYVVKKFFDFKVVIFCYYKIFFLLE